MSLYESLVSSVKAVSYRRIFGSSTLLVATLLAYPLAAHAQQDTISAPKGITPREVSDGSAQLKGALDPTQKLRLVIALRPPHLAEERQFVEDLRTKGSGSFGKFLTSDQWDKRFAPSASDEQAVVDWATAQGFTITGRYPDRLLVDVEAPAASIEKAFSLKLNQYQVAGSLRFSSDRDPVLPGNLVGIIQNVQGLNNIRVMHPMHAGAPARQFPLYAEGPTVSAPSASGKNATAPKPKSLTGKSAGGVSPSLTGGAYDPSDIFSSQAYDVQALNNQGHCCNPLNNPGSSPKETSIAIATAGSQSWSDIAGFHSTYPYLAYNMVQVGIDGQSVPCNSATTACDGEGTMDAEWSTAMSNSFGAQANTALVVLYDGIDSGFGTFDDIYNRIVSDNSTRVMSTSWGCQEGACYDPTDMNTTDAIFMKMVGQGWTLVVASGDKGATAGCDGEDSVQFPSSDPNVVGAGGTTMHLDANGNFVSQAAWSGGPYGCGNNDGGSTGGFSSYWATPSYQSSLGFGSRAVPDLALNADWYNTPQNLYFNGGLGGNGGTSIVAPELAGMFAQFNAYLLTLGNNCLNEGGPCAPMGGLVNPMVYYLAENPSYAPHYPFYDITSGCNNNDITNAYGLGYYCAGSGYDAVTGWGSFNALQLAWGINTYRAGDFGAPTVSFSGPTLNHWYNTDQAVNWTIADSSGLSGYAPNGVSGFSQSWDTSLSDVTSESTPGVGNSFYSGPQFPNGTSGYVNVSWVGQGCHYAHVRAWDNSGFTSGDQTYGPVCYDTTAPVTTSSLSGTMVSGRYVGSVKVTLSASDSTSGIASTVYQVDGGPVLTYSGPFTMSVPGSRTVTFHSTDKAGNVEATKTTKFSISATSKTALAISPSIAIKGTNVSFTAQVSSSSGTPTGNVQFKDGSTVLKTVSLSSGKAQYSTTSLSVASHNITAAYQGDTTHAPSTSSVSEVVVKNSTTTSLASSATIAPKGSSVTFTATITSPSGTPSGTVQFLNGTTVLATEAVSGGKAHYTTSSLSVGTHTITAFFQSTGLYYHSTSSAVSEVIKNTTSTALASSDTSISKGASVTFTATVTSPAGTPTGTVEFLNGTTVMKTVTVSSGKAKYSTSSLSSGTHSITAFFQSPGSYYHSTSPVVKEVVK